MVDNVIHYRYLNKPVVVATVDVPKDERVPSDKIVNFLVSEGIKFDYLAYNREKCRYYAMLNKGGKFQNLIYYANNRRKSRQGNI